ncbi:hypothetical protein U2063_15445, partial [Listeria monocytogenes]|uniref:hypothetical protein n=1 Tax=Listeria monocytogenes TaxID=1639 RepID=UPI002FDB989F
REIRAIKNRVSAQLSRDKKKDDFENLKNQNELLQNKIKELTKALNQKNKEVEILKNHMLLNSEYSSYNKYPNLSPDIDSIIID